MIKVLVDGTALRDKPSGIGLYIYHLIDELAQIQHQENFELHLVYQPSMKNWLTGNFSAFPLLKKYPKLHCLPIPVSLSHRLANYSNLRFDRYLDSPHLIHGTDHVVYPCRHAVKAMTIHDLTFIKYPNWVNSRVKTYTGRVKQCLKWTDLIITVSQSTKQDIIEYLDVKPEKIFVTPLASRYAEVPRISRSLDDLKPYILLVSTLEPRKNVIHLITAFNYLKQTQKIEHRLILIGQKGWQYEPIFAAIANSPYRQEIDHLDYLSDDRVADFYSQADVFVYPSFYEGFGLPILEAMTLGTPVITSNTSSLPEVAGDAAIWIDPQEPMQMAEAILQVIANPQLRQNLIAKGKERVKSFSWEKTARETLNAYQSIL
jgi:glycosyltransferase involved in cell wall biosynthesis